MRVFLTKWMARFVRREGISSGSLLEAVARAERGLIDADLGGGVIKQRMARPGKGRSGGYRIILAYRRTSRAIFVFGFAKSGLENIQPEALNSLQEIAITWLCADERKIAAGLQERELEEVFYESKEVG